MYIMNLKEQFDEARLWVANSMSLESDRYNNLFEITIRILGGLLSAYHLSADEIFLKKAYEVGNRSMPAFSTPSRIPLSDINLMRQSAKAPYWTADSSISEVTTLQLEYKDLTYETKDPRFAEAVKIISQKIHALDKYDDGLVPMFISTNTGRFVGNTITLGARVDSYYEYLIKQWIQSGAKYSETSTDSNDDMYLLNDWLNAVKGVKLRLLGHTKPNNLTFIGESLSGTFSPKMDHLVCFYGGNLALGATYLRKIPKYFHQAEELLDLGESLTETCYQMYAQTATGLSPEIAMFITHEGSTADLYIKPADRHNLLRPETVESLYYLYKITRKKKYQEYGWKIFQSFEKYTKVEGGGYTSIDDVTNVDNVRPRDKMESFFLAETLKYFYLLFESDTEPNIDLTKWLFNTEAHLLPIRS
jgi:endoplasmic reticulum Man9GlcNAc2 1,2-alpha-mannosidase